MTDPKAEKIKQLQADLEEMERRSREKWNLPREEREDTAEDQAVTKRIEQTSRELDEGS